MNQVITTLLCATEDPMRHHRWEPDGRVLDDLLGSIRGGTAVVLHDVWLDPWPDTPVCCAKIPEGTNPYHHRWAAIQRWLAVRPDTGFVWCVDGTDVQMLHEPWEHMTPGVIYCGSEDATWSLPWMLDHHPSIRADAGDQPLMNAGILGGDHATVVAFVDELVAELAACGDDKTDMAAFNRVAARWDVVTGVPVHTRLRGFEYDHPTAWWRHK